MIPFALATYGHTLLSPAPASNLLSKRENIALPIASSTRLPTTDEVLQSDLESRSDSTLSTAPGSFYAAWKTGQIGYNITVPHSICSNGIVGTFTPPSGTIIQNATFGTILQTWYGEHHTGSFLSSYFTTQAQALQTKFDTIMSQSICDLPPRGSRNLLYTVDPATIDGYWTATIINTLAGGSIAIGGIYGAISTNISYIAEASTLAGVGAIEYILYRLIDRLQHQRRFSNMEAAVMSFFLTAGENIYEGFQKCKSSSCCVSISCGSSCMSGEDFLQSFSDLWRATKRQLLTCCGRATTITSFGSSANLVAQGGEPSDNC